MESDKKGRWTDLESTKWCINNVLPLGYPAHVPDWESDKIYIMIDGKGDFVINVVS